MVTLHKQSLTVGTGAVAREPRIVAFECHYGIVGQVEDMKLTISTNRFCLDAFPDLLAAFEQSSKAAACDQRDGISKGRVTENNVAV
jgi:hypothetical protein